MTTLAELLDTTLPLNRKERYYTGTVFPAIVCSDDFAHLSLLGELLPTGPIDVRADPDDCTVLFFTEYGVSESVIGPSAARFTGLPAGKDTPDIVMLITEPTPVLIALEAKLYDRPSKPDLLRQLHVQNELLAYLAAELTQLLGLEVNLVHGALLPRAFADAVGDLGVPVLTWEKLLETYQDLAPRYFTHVLAVALDKYAELASRSGSNQDAVLSGELLVQRRLAGDTTFAWMGRRGGLHGATLAGDLISGAWISVQYQCRRTPLADQRNRNWFSVEDFIERLRAAGQLPPNPWRSQR